MIALGNPAVGANLEIGIEQQIAATALEKLHVVDEVFARTLGDELKIGQGEAVVAKVKDPGGFDHRPGGLIGFNAFRPISGELVVTAGIAQFKTAPPRRSPRRRERYSDRRSGELS